MADQERRAGATGEGSEARWSRSAAVTELRVSAPRQRSAQQQLAKTHETCDVRKQAAVS